MSSATPHPAAPVSLFNLLEEMKTLVLFDRQICPFQFNIHAADPASRVLLITGANATGKSLLFQLWAGWRATGG